MQPPETQENLPLTETTFLILLSLVQEPKHGYAIMKDVQLLSNQRVIMSTGTLYGALKRLLEQGWIVRVDDGLEDTQATPMNGTDRPRKAYSLTTMGHHIFSQELTRLTGLVTTASLRVAGSQL